MLDLATRLFDRGGSRSLLPDAIHLLRKPTKADGRDDHHQHQRPQTEAKPAPSRPCDAGIRFHTAHEPAQRASNGKNIRHRHRDGDGLQASV